MAQLSDDCFAFGDPLMKTETALEALRERLSVIAGIEIVPLREAACRILAEDIVADRAVPPHDNAAVDGFAVFFDDLDATGETALPVAGRIAAGHPLGRPAERGEAYRIFTGAPMPDGADTVLMQEDCRLDGDTVVIPSGIKKGSNRRFAGEDIEAGSAILRQGRRLRPQDIGLAASIGRSHLPVYAKLRVALFSTGDEVHDIGDDLPAGGIFDSNRYAIAALLENLGCIVDDLGILEDRYEPILAALKNAIDDHDVIMTSAGVSTGEEDHVRAAVEALGKLHFWRLAIRPGRPIAFGQLGQVPFIGLPGNPVAVMVTFMRFARPALLLLGGSREVEPAFFRVPVDFAYKKKADRREWLRATLVPGPGGDLRAHKFPRDGAGILSSMVGADGLVELPEDLTRLEPGTMVDFLPFSEVS
ncbi:MAG: molybdopterin molybdotransferase MoeA [Verrucomicrobia bacterium]|nr:molybdopterin molybdotransferase MoeA [Verrucomicrobiota bacterium]